MQANELRDKLKELQDKRLAAMGAGGRRSKEGSARVSTNATFTAEDQKMLLEIRQKLATFQRRPPNPAIAETATLRVTLAPDAEPGERELRLETLRGLSNPIVFCVGQLPEFRKKEPVNAEEGTFRRPQRNNNEPAAVPPTETSITLPAVVNGQVFQGGVDRFWFAGHKGQQLVAAVSARELIPYLADAVPGWFQATLGLYDAKGKEIAYCDRYRFHPDPVIACELPKDGQYYLEIKDSIYRGRDDFVYRITVGELPFLTSVFPLGGPAGAATTLELNGWNLPVTNLVQDVKDKNPGIYPVVVHKDDWISNPLPFAVDTLPECLEQEPNNSASCAQAVTLPTIINGRIDKPGDCDVFRFEGKAGQEIVAEVYARRLDSPLDSVIKLTDSSGHQIAFNDDCEDKGTGLNTHHADSYLRTNLPADGTYYLHLADSENQGGPEYSYRLRLSGPRPDFALRVVPSSINARAGASVPVTVYALRKDGFTNEISLALTDASEGFVLSGGKLAANQDQVRLTIKVPRLPEHGPVALSLEGRATLQGKAVVRSAVPADDMMQAFAYHHLVPAKALEVDVIGNGRFMGAGAIRILSATPVRIPVGGTARVRLGTPNGGFAGRFDLELSEAPEGITLTSLSPTDQGADMVLSSDAGKVKPGAKGNLIVNIIPGKNLAGAQKGKKQANQRPVLGTLPAIPFEVVAEGVASSP
jgi:hypothetical protein